MVMPFSLGDNGEGQVGAHVRLNVPKFAILGEAMTEMGQKSSFLLGCHLGLKIGGWGMASMRERPPFLIENGLQCHTDTEHPASLCPQRLGCRL